MWARKRTARGSQRMYHIFNFNDSFSETFSSSLSIPGNFYILFLRLLRGGSEFEIADTLIYFGMSMRDYIY